MLKANFITADAAAALVRPGDTVCTIGMTLSGASEAVYKAIEKRFLETGQPSGLTIFHSCGQGDRQRGIQHFAHEGMAKRIVGSHWGLLPKWMELISRDKVEAYCLPQGQIAQLYRSMACGLPGKMSKVGLGTFVDPRVEGGKMNARTRALPDIVEVMDFKGEEYLFYNMIPIDVCLIRGTTADEMGNITREEEAMRLEHLAAAMATRRFGGKVVVQVKNLAAAGTLDPKDVQIPGVFVDAVVLCEDPEEDHRQTSSWFFDPSYSGQVRAPAAAIEPLPLDIRKFIGRRASLELVPGAVVNLGIGIPNDVVGGVAAEEGVADDLMMTVESGIYGGVQAGGVDFGIARNIYAMIGHHEQMDYYNGAGIDITFMGAGELDGDGNVNATKMGDRCTGAGGFIDITQNAKAVVFCATFTASGLEVSLDGGRLAIVREGRIRKMVDRVGQVSFNGPIARKKGQKVLFVTERAVFRLCPEGVELIEIAPGVDVRKDVLDLMGFKPIMRGAPKTMDSRLFARGKFGLADSFSGR